MVSPFLDRKRAGQLAHEIDQKWADDQPRRREELLKLRREFLVAHVACKLASRPEHGNASKDELQAMANSILEKAGALTSAPPSRRRNKDEDRILSTGKVLWHKLLKAEGIAAAQPWSRKSPNIPLRSTSEVVRSLSEPGLDAESGQMLLRDYVANHAFHLLTIIEQAKRINPEFLMQDMHDHLVKLYAVCSMSSGQTDKS